MRCAAFWFLLSAICIHLPERSMQQQMDTLDALIKSQFFEAASQLSEINLKSTSPLFMCISKCVSRITPTTSAPPFVPKIFIARRRMINCFTEKSRFAAEKFCSLHGMFFGLPHTEMMALLELLPLAEVTKRRFWSQKFISKQGVFNTTACFYVTRKENAPAENCYEELNFVCSLPAMCHQDACQLGCASSNDKYYCKVSQEDAQPKCYPNCSPVDCSDEPSEKIGTEVVEGQLIETCDSIHFVAKAFFTSYDAANNYCCAKRMKMASLETQSELNCLAKTLNKLNIGKDTKYWTSASSEKCPKVFGWCSSGEFLDNDGLQMSRFDMNASKECVTATFSLNALRLKEDDCKDNKAKVICESPKHFMCTRSECWKFKCPKERELVKGLIAARIFRSRTTTVRACGREFDFNSIAQDSYFKGLKMGCGYDFNLISFETPQKLKCVEEILIANKKVPSGQYWVSGSSYRCHWDNRWCNGEDETPLRLNPDLVWKKGEPSNDTTKECVALDYNAKDKPYLSFFKADCDKKLKLMHESQKKYDL